MTDLALRASDGAIDTAWVRKERDSRRHAEARREASRQRHAYALYIYGATDTAWVRKDGAHDHELKHGAPALGW